MKFQHWFNLKPFLMLLSLSIFSQVWLGCGSEGPSASSEIGNPSIQMARVQDAKGQGISGVWVKRIHTTHWIQKLEKQSSVIMDSAQTNAEGIAVFAADSSGNWQFEVLHPDGASWAAPQDTTTLQLKPWRTWTQDPSSSKELWVYGTSLKLSPTAIHQKIPSTNADLYQWDQGKIQLWMQLPAGNSAAKCQWTDRLTSGLTLHSSPNVWTHQWAWIGGTSQHSQKPVLCWAGTCSELEVSSGEWRRYMEFTQDTVFWTLGYPQDDQRLCGFAYASRATSPASVQWIRIQTLNPQRSETADIQKSLGFASGWMSATLNQLIWKSTPATEVRKAALISFLQKTDGSLDVPLIQLNLTEQELANINPNALRDSLEERLGPSKHHRIALIESSLNPNIPTTQESLMLSLWRNPEYSTWPMNAQALEKNVLDLNPSQDKPQAGMLILGNSFGSQAILILKQWADLGITENGNFQTGNGHTLMGYFAAPRNQDQPLDLNAVYLLPEQSKCLLESEFFKN
jgi:hypothetical protein